MTEQEFQVQLGIAAAKAKMIIMRTAPVRTGNLMRSIRVSYNENGFSIYIDENQAPYMAATEETWKSPRWGGRGNPNEGWFAEAADLVARMIAAQFGTTPKQK